MIAFSNRPAFWALFRLSHLSSLLSALILFSIQEAKLAYEGVEFRYLDQPSNARELNL
jgi:hypothetical protein